MSKVAVVIPCYRVAGQILQVLAAIGAEVQQIYVIDDHCPENTGRLVADECRDDRVTVLFHEHNQGVGGATMTGFKAALEKQADIIVKLDGDGQMDPVLIPKLIDPIQKGLADYTKGNRFFDLSNITRMPLERRLGNLALSFMSKPSGGYWKNFDPTNGFVAIHRKVLARLPLAKIDRRFFFETDMLFRLNALRAVVYDLPMDVCYGEERSNLKIGAIIPSFFFKHLRNTLKRVFYNYYLRDFSLASIEIAGGFPLLLFGVLFGLCEWSSSISSGIPVSSGTVMLAALPIILGVQFLLGFLAYDIENVPNAPIHPYL